ncbi:MAG: UDP-3-O-(3-hydroxymyristoyl)glucosamine N-acyltransferase [Neomegalonema sp.]|nr:UDP-3-O-(3-hydroxymyristoyl)glucosamine N-acyltransferase [Neomegalonema sp.]
MITVAQIAEKLGFEAEGETGLQISGAAHPKAAGPDQLALAMDPKFTKLLKDSAAQAAMVPPGFDWQEAGLRAAIIVPRARFGLAGITRAFAIAPHAPEGIHPSAVVDPTAQIGQDVRIGALAVVGPRVRLGDRAVILPQATIGEDAVIAEDCLIHAGVRIGARVTIGARSIIQPGAVIGGDGFSFVTPEKGSVESVREGGAVAMGAENRVWARIYSLGSVEIGEDVEIGANCCIDRGTVVNTRIGHGSKLDNLVQVGHNVQIGENCLVCGQVGIAGSAEIGNRVVLGGQSGIADHVRIGDDCVALAMSGIAGDLAPRSVVMGAPAGPRKIMTGALIAVRRLPQLMRDVQELKKRFPLGGQGG